MRFSTILILASMTTALACGADDSDDTGAGTDTDPSSTTMSTTDPSTTTMSTTDPSTTVDPSSSTDPSTTVDPSSSTDPSTTEPGTESSGDPDTGTTGGDANCELYCATFIATCQDENGGLDGADPYTDMDACMTTCAGFEPGMEGDQTPGNTLACRGYHLMNAIAMSGAGHCGHADADGSGVCV